MSSISARLATRFLVPLFAVLIGCGGGGSTSTGTTGGGGSGSGGGSATSTSTGTATATSTGTGTGTSTSTGSGVPGPPVPMGAPIYNLAIDAGTVIKPGFMAGYGIITDGAGDFTLVWTGNAKAPNPAVAFEGSVWTTGKFTSASPGCSDSSCSLDGTDMLGPIQDAMGGGQYIGFKASSLNELDGFEFSTDKEPVYFDLLYDGQELNGRVVYADADTGGSPSNPQKIPFGIVAKP